MSRRTYTPYHCWLCGKWLESCNGAAVYSHNMAHVRRGEMTHKKTWTADRGTRHEFNRAPKPPAAQPAQQVQP